MQGNPKTAHIPIIAQTGWSSGGWKAAALAAGMVAYLQKPVSMEMIISTIRKVPLGFAGHRRLTESISRQSLYVCKIWLSLTVVVSPFMVLVGQIINSRRKSVLS